MANLYLLFKGDKIGHPFRGNQWTKTGHKFTAAQLKVIEDCKIPKSFTDIQVALNPNAITKARAKNPNGQWCSFRTKDGIAKQDAIKFARTKELNADVVRTSTKAQKDMMNKALPQKHRDAAAVIAIVSLTGMRPATDNEANTGARTLQRGDAVVNGNIVKYDFIGKSNKRNLWQTDNKNVAAYISQRKAQMAAEGRRGNLFDVSATYVNSYFKEISGGEFKVKDYRTFHANRVALAEIEKIKRAPKDKKALKAAMKKVATAVAKHLNNSPAEAIKSYIDPALWARWEISA